VMGEYFSVCLHAVIRGDPPNILISSPSLEGEEASSLTARNFLTRPPTDRYCSPTLPYDCFAIDFP